MEDERLQQTEYSDRLITFEPEGEIIFDYFPTSTIMGKLFVRNHSGNNKYLFRITGNSPEHYVVIPSHGTIERNEKKQIKLLMKASRSVLSKRVQDMFSLEIYEYTNVNIELLASKDKNIVRDYIIQETLKIAVKVFSKDGSLVKTLRYGDIEASEIASTGTERKPSNNVSSILDITGEIAEEKNNPREYKNASPFLGRTKFVQSQNYQENTLTDTKTGRLSQASFEEGHQRNPSDTSPMRTTILKKNTEYEDFGDFKNYNLASRKMSDYGSSSNKEVLESKMSSNELPNIDVSPLKKENKNNALSVPQVKFDEGTTLLKSTTSSSTKINEYDLKFQKMTSVPDSMLNGDYPITGEGTETFYIRRVKELEQKEYELDRKIIETKEEIKVLSKNLKEMRDRKNTTPYPGRALATKPILDNNAQFWKMTGVIVTGLLLGSFLNPFNFSSD